MKFTHIDGNNSSKNVTVYFFESKKYQARVAIGHESGKASVRLYDKEGTFLKSEILTLADVSELHAKAAANLVKENYKYHRRNVL